MVFVMKVQHQLNAIERYKTSLFFFFFFFFFSSFFFLFFLFFFFFFFLVNDIFEMSPITSRDPDGSEISLHGLT